jgi:hypothetical protein
MTGKESRDRSELPYNPNEPNKDAALVMRVEVPAPTALLYDMPSVVPAEADVLDPAAGVAIVGVGVDAPRDWIPLFGLFSCCCNILENRTCSCCSWAGENTKPPFFDISVCEVPVVVPDEPEFDGEFDELDPLLVSAPLTTVACWTPITGGFGFEPPNEFDFFVLAPDISIDILINLKAGFRQRALAHNLLNWQFIIE